MVPRRSTSLKIDMEIWKEGKKRAIDLELTVGKYIEKLIKQDIKNRQK